jgi:P27 family predicted phage terminase small subunit
VARPRKPTALKVLQGTTRAGRENPDEPQLPVRETTYLAPIWLEPNARAEWDRLEAVLRSARILTEGDLAIFANYCSRFASAMRADGYVSQARTKKAWAYWDGIARKAWEAMNKAAQQLGLTPAARGKVARAPEGKKDPLAKYTGPRAG